MRKLGYVADRFMDPEDLRPVYLRIAEELRNAYQPGAQLASVPKIAEEWGVAKETVRSAVDVLRSEGLVVSWQGRGTFYRVRADDNTNHEPDNPEVLRRLDQIMARLDEFESRLDRLEKPPE